MSGKIIGYIRVSSIDQNPDRQLEGIKLDKKFIDKISAVERKKPALTELLEYVRDGDTVIVHSMDRLARNLDELRNIVKQLVSSQIKVQFIKENLTFTGEDSPMANLLLSVMGAFAEFERSFIKERQAEGIALAKKKGVYKGRSPALSNEQIQELQRLVAMDVPKSVIARQFNISRTLVYKYMKYEIKGKTND